MTLEEARTRASQSRPELRQARLREKQAEYDRRIAKAGVSTITVHGARKTCGSLLAALDVHPRVAMQILRHSKIAVTMEIYTEAPSDATREALRKLGDWLA